MSMPSELREKTVLAFEGYWLQTCINSEGGTMHARCSIDGAINAIVRLDGEEAAAKYAFALADRLVGRLPITPWPPAREVVNLPALEAAIAPPPAPPAKPKSLRFWTVFGLGWVSGYVSGVVTS